MQDFEPVRGARANQITERQEDAKKVGGAIAEIGNFRDGRKRNRVPESQ